MRNNILHIIDILNSNILSCSIDMFSFEGGLFGFMPEPEHPPV